MMWFYVGFGVTLLLIFQRKAFMRVLSAISAQINKFSMWVMGYDAIAVYQNQVNKYVEEMNNSTEKLAEYRGETAATKRAVVRHKKEIAEIDANIKLYLTKGDESRAADYSLQLQQKKKDLERDEALSNKYEEKYQNNFKKLEYARAKINEARQRARHLKADLKMAEFEEAEAKACKNLNINVGFDELAEIEEQVQSQIDYKLGKAEVFNDLSKQDLDKIEHEEALKKQAAADILAQYKSEMNLKN